MGAQFATKASQNVHAYTGTNPILFIKHIIVPRHDRLRNNIKPMQIHFNPQPLARWRHSIITKWRVSICFNFNFNLIQRALVLEDYAPALGVAGFVSRKKGARSKGKEEKEGKNNNSR